ncbi:chemotaxis response regulator protein-glutamate methylesterase [Desulfosarcina ovata subsp. sediminis]|uniref:protein-glutamate methylesterase n=1 Tax=Desulfosarcina ovata subsp. sediminis TaxID=885957 RepID=A0A5K7ZQR8_9BACT|nr:chemotaxis protein CheB [Desulfosarcina ovata]BBO79873.1 chemotaxis response regulator protein-glutamate methylesterase [Desulfosarcina ovata subsp. sediminis]
MIIFCEECGARNDLTGDALSDGLHTFACRQCSEMLMISRPSLDGGLHAFAGMVPGESEAPETEPPISILIVDDSTVLRKIVKEIFAADNQLKVVGEAENGLKALELIPQIRPDVVTLDVNMPVMDGLTTIKHIMIKCPTPVVMFSTLTGQGAQETFEALRYGAVDFLQKPSSLLKEDLKSQHDLIVSRVKNAARAGVDTIRYLRLTQQNEPTPSVNGTPCRHVFAIGSTYGSYGALLGLVPELNPALPAAYLSVLYATPTHVEAFARYLDAHSPMTVSHATDGQPIRSGTCYLASVFETVTLQGDPEHLSIRLRQNASMDPEHATDHLMTSMAGMLKDRAAGVLLSGIGDDGVRGSGRIMEAGGWVILQDPKTCLCSDITASAVKRYGLPTVLPGARMAQAIHSRCQEMCE